MDVSAIIPSAENNPDGLHVRYRVFDADLGEPAPGEYFVLRLDGDGDPAHVAACRKAMLAYADEIEPHLPRLAADVRARYGR